MVRNLGSRRDGGKLTQLDDPLMALNALRTNGDYMPANRRGGRHY